MADEQRRIGQEGSRWFNQPPTGAEFAEWFEQNVAMHDGLDHKDYVQGVTLIPNTEKAKAVVGWQDGAPVIQRVENLVYTPYAKVETRVKYFHDLMAQHEKDWLGVIEPVVPEKSSSSLPPGFFPYAVQTGENTVQRYVCCSMKVTVFERETVKMRERLNARTGEMERWREGRTIIDAAPATKMIATLGRYGPDEFALMKAETGAVGRALGMAGMLVIPGTGIATAEDLQEAELIAGGRGGAPVPEEAQPPVETEAKPSEEQLTDLRQQAIIVMMALKNEFPDAFEEFKKWAQERQIGEVGSITDARVLQGLTNKADRDLANARAAAKGE